MPQMGVSVAEGTVVSWRVEVGDRIAAEETICEVSTDKIDTELPAPVSGVVAEILVPLETTVSVGTVLARIAPAGSDVEVPAAQGAPSAQPRPTPPLHQHAEPPAHERPPPSAAGAPSRSDAPDSGTSNGGQLSREYSPVGEASRHYSPVVKRIAAEHGVDLSLVEGSGRGGRVRKQDVIAFIESASASQAPLHIESPYRPEPALEPSPSSGQLPRVRRQIGEHMKRSLETAAHCTTWIEVDMSRVESARARLGVTALAFVARASIDALREHPALNAWLEGERYTRHADVNLGVAVSLGEDGLIVPVIPKAHELSVEGLAGRIKELARRARERELTPDEVHGGTFTITNPGQYGSIMATPIINQPQVAILDFEATVKRPVAITDAAGADAIAIRPMTILGLSWDHRALDGAQAAQFLASVKRHLEGVTIG
jgi:pyruvate/2-oxoglutarate dehydrogenase complex dihydrolipoamide acyltransferase (E2) component